METSRKGLGRHRRGGTQRQEADTNQAPEGLLAAPSQLSISHSPVVLHRTDSRRKLSSDGADHGHASQQASRAGLWLGSVLEGERPRGFLGLFPE